MQTNEPSDSIISYLQDFGLGEKEARLYFSISKFGQVTASELTRSLHYSRLQTYRLVKNLLNRGLIEVSMSRPRKYSSVELEKALAVLEEEARNRYLELKTKKTHLIEEWEKVRELRIREPLYAFRMIQGTLHVRHFTKQMFESAKQNIDTVLKGQSLDNLEISGYNDTLRRSAQRGVSVRCITSIDSVNIRAARKFLESCNLRRFPTTDLAHVSIIDGKEAIISLTGDLDHPQAEPENAIWTNHPDLVNTMKSFFGLTWGAGQVFTVNDALKRGE